MGCAVGGVTVSKRALVALEDAAPLLAACTPEAVAPEEAEPEADADAEAEEAMGGVDGRASWGWRRRKVAEESCAEGPGLDTSIEARASQAVAGNGDGTECARQARIVSVRLTQVSCKTVSISRDAHACTAWYDDNTLFVAKIMKI